jgi:hypothetical protein
MNSRACALREAPKFSDCGKQVGLLKRRLFQRNAPQRLTGPESIENRRDDEMRL